MPARKTKSNGTWPAPVYEAHFNDGTIARMSFWTQYGKPYNVDRGRRLFTPGVPLRLKSNHFLRDIFDGKEVVDGYIEHDIPGEPWLRFRDPHFSGEAAPVPVAGETKKRTSIKGARRVVRELLAAVESGNVRDDVIQEARQLIAA